MMAQCPASQPAQRLLVIIGLSPLTFGTGPLASFVGLVLAVPAILSGYRYRYLPHCLVFELLSQTPDGPVAAYLPRLFASTADLGRHIAPASI
ncbi:hypothetical protein BO71DRAFT_432729 [Aspergillus ellipticus CBS 707.79]|uniref:Uncharacterized protein n=1 Tax=Aspergillus ellipticus CBS 707.79 TaxID=1448320 RepID=A0A319DK27_9EURO|nr:hypothetical protein BO71DRAFT_432729 [Aspergillus ellipticus CBS 707.79]